MSRSILAGAPLSQIRTRPLLAIAAIAGLLPSILPAQAALGTPFIGKNNLSFVTSELTRSGGPEMTNVFGVVYGRQFGSSEQQTRLSMVLRGSARAFDAQEQGILDVGATVAVTHAFESVRGLAIAASAGVGTMAWGDDGAQTGRLRISIPATAGVSYDLKVGSATFSPFANAAVAPYDLRTYQNDVRMTDDKGWDAQYTTGASLRLKELVLTSSRVFGEYGMPKRSRWGFSAGISF